MQLLISPVTVFSLGMPEMQVFVMSCKDPFLRWGLMAGSAICNWLSFQYLLLDTILMFFFFEY